MENKNKKYEDLEVIEPEVFDEQGRKISSPGEPRAESVKRDFDPLRRGLMGVLGAAAALLSGFMTLCVFLAVFVVMAIPMLILSLFGRKPNIKIFKYKM
ncbi:hypothetical protein [Candidatus Proelusimicrobium volucris]|uniref:hypothetical protein n=1 Tax=Candidatus Proelusimicrobium volucris TaxID=3416225 RepID=UPI003D0A5B5D